MWIFLLFLSLFSFNSAEYGSYPSDLPDPNGDGKADLADFFRAFRNMVKTINFPNKKYMNQYDIYSMFVTFDHD